MFFSCPDPSCCYEGDSHYALQRHIAATGHFGEPAYAQSSELSVQDMNELQDSEQHWDFGPASGRDLTDPTQESIPGRELDEPGPRSELAQEAPIDKQPPPSGPQAAPVGGKTGADPSSLP